MMHGTETEILGTERCTKKSGTEEIQIAGISNHVFKNASPSQQKHILLESCKARKPVDHLDFFARFVQICETISKDIIVYHQCTEAQITKTLLHRSYKYKYKPI